LGSNKSNRTEVIDITNEDLSKSFFNGHQEQEYSEKPQYHLQRKLAKPQIQMIALGGTLGVGLFLNSGKAFSIGGPLGCFLGFLISGSIVLATMLSFAEMSTLIPTTSSISGLASRFVEDAFGFALGWCYFIAFAIAMPSEVCAGTIMLSYYQNLDIPSPSTAGFVVLFLSAILSINLFDVRFYGNIEYGFSFFKVVVCAVLICTMVAINIRQGYGFMYWNSATSTQWETRGPFRPTFDLNDVGTGALNGIGGALGRLLGTISSILISSYAYTGSEIGFVASMECKNPRKALPSVTKRVFGRVVILYMLSIFLVGLNMYSGDPRLLRYYQPDREVHKVPAAYLEAIETKCPKNLEEGVTNGNQSPWTIALQSAGYCSFSNVLNAIFVLFAVSAGSSHLYVSSRTLYSMATQKKAPAIFAKCTRNGVPYTAVLFSGSFGLLAFLSINNSAMSVFQDFANISAATAMLMWAGMCLSFLRFYYGLKLRPDIISRDDSSYPYRSPFQPYLAVYGFLGSMTIVLLMGFVVFLKGFWDTKTFFTSYGALVLFALCYCGYKVFRSSKIHRLDQLDLDSGRREMDRIIWDEEQYYISSIKELAKKFIGWLA
jgi:amino acid transporter